MTGVRPAPPADDCIAFVTVRLHAPGTISISGHVADRRLCLQLLDHARDAIKRQIPDDHALVLPNRDVSVTPRLTLREFGDLAPGDRGDG